VSYCAIGLGSNLGDSPQILTRAIAQLGAVPHIQLKKVASYYRTKPIGPPQPDYLNSSLGRAHPGFGFAFLWGLADR
jgi:2-amino-4-hydroxy-6-hydroxymethyldihydropteridine diphosphokinase